MPERRFSFRLIVRKFQLRFLFANLLHFCLIALVLAGTIFGPPAFQLLTASTAPADRAAAATVFLALHGSVWLGLVLACLIGLARMAVVSHRIAGPLVRMVATLRAVQRGDVSMRFKVRSSDYLAQEAAALDAMTMRLRRRIRAAQGRALKLDAALEDLRAAHGPRSGELFDRRFGAVDEQIRRLREHLDRFQTQPRAEPTASVLPSPSLPSKETARATPSVGPQVSRQERGFTLIELMLVVVIISTLATLAVPAYGEALNRARIVRAIGELRSIGTELQQFHLSTGGLPDTLAAAGISLLQDPYGMPYQYTRIAGGEAGKGGLRKDHKLNPINSDFDLFSMGRDKVFKTQLTNKDSLDDIVRANDGAFVGVAADY
jgi:general secretion pathway protein G